MLGKEGIWPPGYLRFILRGDPRCFEIPTHLTLRERLLLYRLGVGLPSRANLVEIGSYLGASACFLASAAREIGGQVFCVDTWCNDAMSEGERDTHEDFVQNTQMYAAWITPLRGDSLSVARTFSTPIDLLFIDADHSYSAVKADLSAWAPKVRSGGWIVLHDWGWAEGVQRATAEMIAPIQCGAPLTLPNLYAAQVMWNDQGSV
jgi:predicted O-methyltransferase YrrM